MNHSSHEVTRLLDRVAAGDELARSELASLIYPQIHRIAQGLFRRERAGHSAQPTALANEAIMKVFYADGQKEWEDRAHVLATLACAIRYMLLDRVKRRHVKERVMDELGRELDAALDQYESSIGAPYEELEKALKQLSEEEPTLAPVVDLRFFHGMRETEAAEILGVPATTIESRWRRARKFLKAKIQSNQRHG